MSLHFSRARAALEAATEPAMLAGAEYLLGEANQRVPLETGALAQSGNTAVDGEEAAVGYTSVYACRQHEEVGWSHPNGREAKWLENTVNESGEEALQAIADVLNEAF